MALKSSSVLIKAYNAFLAREQNIHSSYNALKTINMEHERIHAGKMFHYSQVTSLADSATMRILISVSSDSMPNVRDINYETNDGPCELKVYEEPYIDVASLGIGIVPENLNRLSSNVPVNSFYQDAYIDANSAGTVIDHRAIVQSAGGAIQTITGQAGNAAYEWVLAGGKNYVFELTNNAGGTAFVSETLIYYEPGD